MFETDILLQDSREILGAVPVTLAMALTIFVLSTMVGSLFALVEYRRIPALRELVMAYKVVFKGVPMVIVIFLAYFGLPPALQFLFSLVGIDFNAHQTPNWVILVIAVTGCVAAFQAEIIKGALNAFDTGQADAAYSLGYTRGQLFRRVLFPQVALTAIPDLTTSMMVIMKALSLGFAIEVVDIFAQSQLTAALNFYYLEAFVIAVVIYMVIAYLVTQIADRLEQALRVRT
ncbi:MULTISPECIES: amino acid ABC transporter permease [unclassified Mesorhizobium]|uniref:amino acid ABC transporter permease n=1 Tax=unclassified Mesorhizobium TaxID=325217 RepID=UPI00112A99C2|nr:MULTISPECIES: amino acid ABC transporter permease [unclassified Mesorhizobium]TPJ40620.1 amino acid ABC transporter permease [Mesorhizobium sp. B2-6-6]MBZ9959613.1 amino acid ABC transporter permease [Mesorhizobium sp. BR1-1-14]MCA0000129.1 amino acid ABC transporter permease [Mesorhizobium sp. B264B2A]MCA0006180.1 amino acid ABC transporter permease [Mesorhizobium sp. B264B1B]MCA0017771.1 amino acid ABC transporter permease [Mesorhizobium sp. B264B1A]